MLCVILAARALSLSLHYILPVADTKMMWIVAVLALFATSSAQESLTTGISSLSTPSVSPTPVAIHHPSTYTQTPQDDKIVSTHHATASLEDTPLMASSQTETKAVVYRSTVNISPTVHTSQLQDALTTITVTQILSETANYITETVEIAPTITHPEITATSIAAAATSNIVASTTPSITATSNIVASITASSNIVASTTPSITATSNIVASITASSNIVASTTLNIVASNTITSTNNVAIPTGSATDPPPTTPSERRTPGAIVPLWVWIIVAVGILFLFSCCAICCTIYLCVKRNKASRSGHSSQQSFRRTSQVALANGSEREIGSDKSTVEMLYPTQETTSKEFKKGRPVSRWDSLRTSWSRRSSRRKISTFKPQLYLQERSMTLPASNSKPYPPAVQDCPTTTFGDYSHHGRTSQNPVPSHGNPDYKSQDHVTNSSYDSPDHNPSYGNPNSNISPATNTSYGNPNYTSPVPNPSYESPAYNPSYGNPDYKSPVTDPATNPVPNPSYGSPAYNPSYGNPDYQSPVPNPSYGNPTYKSPVTNPSYGNPEPAFMPAHSNYQSRISYSECQSPVSIASYENHANPSYGNNQRAFLNPSYDFHSDQETGASLVCADPSNGYCNSSFNMKEKHLSSQGSNTEPLTAYRQKKLIENLLHFNKRK